MGICPSGERSRIASRRLPKPTYDPSGKRRSHSPESSGPRCACTWVIRARTSRFPQFTTPLIPHMSARIPFEFVDFGFGVKHLHCLKSTINKPRNTVQESEAKEITVQEKQNR